MEMVAQLEWNHIPLTEQTEQSQGAHGLPVGNSGIEVGSDRPADRFTHKRPTTSDQSAAVWPAVLVETFW